jgi:hypothetical protein
MAYPASPFTLTAVFTAQSPLANFNLAGVAIAASLTAKLIFAGIRWATNQGSAVLTYNTATSFNSGSTTQSSIFPGSLLGVRVQDDGTNLTISFSTDGYVWRVVQTGTKAASWLGSTGFNFLGVVIDTDGGPVSTTLLAWNITTP